MAETVAGSSPEGTISSKLSTLDGLLEGVKEQIATYEAKRLGEQKTELEALVKQKPLSVADYNAKYPTLYARWCAQHQQVETLYKLIQQAFPGQVWTDIVSTCICKKRHDEQCKTKEIEEREYCSQGKNQRLWSQAKAVAEAAKASLDTLVSNAQKIDAGLLEIDKLIKEIQALVPGPDKAVALYLFWFKLLPIHMDLLPDKVSAECKAFGTEQTPEKLCAKELAGPCDFNNPCKPETANTDKVEIPRAWLMDPDRYPKTLDDAWKKYQNSKTDLAAKEVAYKSAPDDLDTLRKNLDDFKKKLEAEIKDCLKKEKPEDKCRVNLPADATFAKSVGTSTAAPANQNPEMNPRADNVQRAAEQAPQQPAQLPTANAAADAQQDSSAAADARRIDADTHAPKDGVTSVQQSSPSEGANHA